MTFQPSHEAACTCCASGREIDAVFSLLCVNRSVARRPRSHRMVKAVIRCLPTCASPRSFLPNVGGVSPRADGRGSMSAGRWAPRCYLPYPRVARIVRPPRAAPAPRPCSREAAEAADSALLEVRVASLRAVEQAARSAATQVLARCPPVRVAAVAELGRAIQPLGLRATPEREAAVASADSSTSAGSPAAVPAAARGWLAAVRARR